jgi:hypothetical protein
MPRISEAEFLNAVRTFSQSAFRLEVRGSYALDYERRDFEGFLAGSPVPPPEVDWWRPWLDRVARITREGKTISRVRVLAEPPTDYQRWHLWAAPWHASAGEGIRYLSRSTAERIGLPLADDWWLLDDERVIIMTFTAEGEIDSKTLVTDPESVAGYRVLQDIAIRNSALAESISA